MSAGSNPDAASSPAAAAGSPAASAALALVMSGGGARCAYQAGFLRGIVRRRPDFTPKILTGVSAGGINAAFLANARGSFAERVEALRQLWLDIRTEDVFETSVSRLLPKVAKWGLRLVTGRAGEALHLRGMVDTAPLERFLCSALEAPDGELRGVEENLRRGELEAVALTASTYDTGRSLTWIQGRREIAHWSRAHRRSEYRKLHVRHVMASAALPLFFPAVEVDGQWYGDGGIRLTAPLSPAVHLGARRILALTIRLDRGEAVDGPLPQSYPPPAQVIGSLLSAIFLDQFDNDALRLERINRLLHEIPPERRGPFEEIGLLVHRPSQDLGRIANDFEAELPIALRFLTRGLGTNETRSNDLLSLVMFQPDYIERLMELGERDAVAHAASIDAFLG